MQEEKLEASPCRVKTCPAMSKPGSQFTYCPIHEKTATDPDMFQKALDGKLNAGLREFAKDVERGLYPKRIW